jgi:hypothetical protein
MKIKRYGFEEVIRKMLAECNNKNKKSAILTMEDVGEFEHCNIILKVEVRK